MVATRSLRDWAHLIQTLHLVKVDNSTALELLSYMNEWFPAMKLDVQINSEPGKTTIKER